MRTLTVEPLVPFALWCTLALAALALLGWYGYRRPAAIRRLRWTVIVALMGLGIALVLTILLNLTWVEPVAPPGGKPILTVLVDATASMATPDAPGNQTRYEAAIADAAACTRDLQDRFDVHLKVFADAVAASDLHDLQSRPPVGQVTDLAAAVVNSLDPDRPQGQALILLSDGIHNAAGGTGPVLDAVRAAKAMACPIYTHTIGGDTAVRDLAVELRSPQELAFVGQKTAVTVLLRHGGLTSGQATLTLRYGDKEIDRRQVPLTVQGPAEVRFEVQPEKTGIYRYEVEAAPFPGEVNLANNSATFLVRVVDEPIRILLLEGKPYWDAKFLVRTLSADPSVEVDSIVRISDQRIIRRSLRRPAKGAHSPAPSSPAPAATAEDWRAVSSFSEALPEAGGLRSYQVIVLGREAETFLNEGFAAQLRSWLLRDGGSLVCFRGQPVAQADRALAQLMPVRWSPATEARFRVQMTQPGRDLGWLINTGTESDPLSSLPSLAASARPGQPKPLATVLATGRFPGTSVESPVLTYQPYGSGRVVAVEGAGMWRWAFLPPAQRESDEIYRALWHNLLRWLVSHADLLPGQKWALRSDKVRFSPTETASVSLLVRDEAAKGQIRQIELEGPAPFGGRTFDPFPLGEEPGMFRAAFGKLPEGRYLARVAGAARDDPASVTAFDVRSSFEEQLDLRARPELMARIASESGGEVLTGAGPENLVAQFREHQARSLSQSVYRRPAWDRWWVLVGVVATWGTAWALRRSAGLI